MELNGTHQLLVYADNVNIFGGNVSTMKRTTRAQLDDGREVGLEANSE
jgi:hypothetical protein